MSDKDLDIKSIKGHPEISASNAQAIAAIAAKLPPALARQIRADLDSDIQEQKYLFAGNQDAARAAKRYHHPVSASIVEGLRQEASQGSLPDEVKKAVVTLITNGPDQITAQEAGRRLDALIRRDQEGAARIESAIDRTIYSNIDTYLDSPAYTPSIERGNKRQR